MVDTFDSLKVIDISYFGSLKYWNKPISVEDLKDFTASFTFGRSYLLNGQPTDGGWAISWIMAGNLKPLYGTILLNGQPTIYKHLNQLSWSVGFSKIKLRYQRETSVVEQLQYGIKRGLSIPHWKREDYIRQFRLDEPTLGKRLSRVSGDMLHTSCAVGLANGKRIFCFPYIKTWQPNLLDTYIGAGFKHIIEVLTSFGCLVIMPMLVKPRFRSLCDEIVDVYTWPQNPEP